METKSKTYANMICPKIQIYEKKNTHTKNKIFNSDDPKLKDIKGSSVMTWKESKKQNVVFLLLWSLRCQHKIIYIRHNH